MISKQVLMTVLVFSGRQPAGGGEGAKNAPRLTRERVRLRFLWTAVELIVINVLISFPAVRGPHEINNIYYK